ncbi:hypothetical protein [Umezakia ovalisporum]|uniref:Uncharacterized protein n=1 Tax=Umezakia ovalisporum FSS-43 TaxID=2740520 RepID=A0ABT6K7R0_9CYAN|nr:hypothetical protein [Umezakia ovalisporum]MDH6058298.1 hypothetical protein [Umezakia ovalisporum FSS-43]MDH6066594.1 hypothetical protein [Umezakia ovalisporum APH033B]MDH6072848.1 hypothetical protein [Umezakia ovalisporum CS-1034]MDH6084840.1 hypothetical protein [Umezakia ovalisporum TAC611]
MYVDKKHSSMLAHAQNLVYTLKQLMLTQYQKDNSDVDIILTGTRTPIT